jgi:hypothetical protein
MHTSDTTHLETVHPILCYVKCIINIGLHFFFYITLDLLAFSNVDWEGCHTTRHSTIRFCVFLGNNLISYCVKKQHTISRSNTKAEYRFMANTISEVTLMTFILKDLHIPVQSPPILYCDYLNALHMTVNPVFHARSKYIELDYHFVQEQVVIRQLVTKHVFTNNQVVDLLTKPMLKKCSCLFSNQTLPPYPI